MDGGVARRSMVDLRSAQQRRPQGPRRDRGRTGRLGRGNGDHVRWTPPAGDDGTRRGGAGVMLDRGLLMAPVLDHDAVDLDDADRVTYLLEQSFCYDYT